MGVNKIDVKTLHRLSREGKTCTQIAQYFGVSPSAVSQKMKQLKANINKNMALINANHLANSDLNLIDKTNVIERRLVAAADFNWKLMNGDQATLDVAQKARKLARTQFTDPGLLFLKSMGELAKVVKLKQELLESLFDIRQIVEFQQEVLSILSDVSPEVRHEIIKRLKENRALAQSLRIHR